MPGPVSGDARESHSLDGARLSELSPESLLACFVDGQEEAFTVLVNLVGGRLFAFIQRFLGHHHLAEDTYQTVLTKVAIHAGSFDQRAKLNTWMYRIARNACLDALRQKKRQRTVSLDSSGGGADDGGLSMAETLVSPDLEPGECLTVEELGARIVRAVDTLPTEQREVFLLKEEAEFTFEQIGDMLGIGKETAKSRFRYATQRLRNALGSEARLFGVPGS